MTQEIRQEMSAPELEYLQAIVHRIATHIVEGSAAVYELKSFVANLKNARPDIEYAVHEHWLKAAKIIKAAGKEKSSWEKFIKSLQMSYGDDEEITLSQIRASEDEDTLLPIASNELWVHEARNNVDGTNSITNLHTRFVETVDHGYYDFGKQSEKPDLREGIAYDTENLAQAAMTLGESNYKTSKGNLSDGMAYDSEKLVQATMTIVEPNYKTSKGNLSERIGYDVEKLAQAAMPIGEPNYKTSKGNLSERIVYDTEKFAQAAMTIGEPNYKMSKGNLSERIVYDTKKLAQAAMTIGKPNYKTSKGKKRKWGESSELVGEGDGGGGTKVRSSIQFTNGRKVAGDKVVALKKGGRCFFCERKGHRAKECKDNPDNQGKL